MGCKQRKHAGRIIPGCHVAYHDLFQPQRETNLRVRLNEYLRLGLEAGIIYVT